MVRGKLKAGGGKSQTVGNDSPVVGIGSEKAEVFVGKSEGGVRSFSLVKASLLTLSLALAAAISVGEENSVRRLENAQKGMAEGSWPRKPDNRLSSLSGKMKDMAEISPRFYGQEKEFRARSWGDGEREAGPSSASNWETPSGKQWEDVRWNQAGDRAGHEAWNEKFQPSADLAATRTLSYRELSRESAPDWSSRSSSLAGSTDGSLRMYQGRLVRVREQVAREEKNVRDLGPGRQEKFSPEEVEKMLAEPVGELRGTVTGQSAGASLPLAAGN